MDNLTRFLNKFSGIVTCNNPPSNKMTIIDSKAISLANSAGKDIYFYVNSGGTKQKDITMFNACFVDLDAGKANGRYLSDHKVRIAKTDMMALIGNFPVKPNYVVESKNGYQVYWLIQLDATYSNEVRWKTLQKKICSYFGEYGDPRALKTSKILRVPTTNWWKNGQTPYKTSFRSTKVISAKALAGQFNKLETALASQPIKLVKSNNYSKPFVKPHAEPVDVAKEPVSDDKTKTLVDISNFLKEIHNILLYKGHPFMAGQSKELIEKLTKEFNVS